jgi:hypothetical protein
LLLEESANMYSLPLLVLIKIVEKTTIVRGIVIDFEIIIN